MFIQPSALSNYVAKALPRLSEQSEKQMEKTTQKCLVLEVLFTSRTMKASLNTGVHLHDHIGLERRPSIFSNPKVLEGHHKRECSEEPFMHLLAANCSK